MSAGCSADLVDIRTQTLRLIACVALICLLSLLLTSRYHAIDRMGYQKAALQQELRNLERQHQALSLEVARLSSLERVEALALTELGMVRATETLQLGRPPAALGQVEDDVSWAALAAGDSASPWWLEPDTWLLQLFARVARAESRP